MNRFNLTFRGEILEGHEPEQAQASLADALGIDDPEELQSYFSGDPVVLRRNLERKEAAQLYAQLRRLGILAELVKIGERGDLHAGESINAVSANADMVAATPKKELPATPADTTAAPSLNEPTEADADTAEIAEIEVSQDTASSGEDANLRAALAARKAEVAQQKAELEDRERNLREALKAKEKEDDKQRIASARALEKAAARAARQQARLEAASEKAAQAAEKRKTDADAAEREALLQRQEDEAAAKRKAERERAQALETKQRAEAAAERRRQDEAAAEREAERELAQAQEAKQRADAEAAHRAEQARQEQARREERKRKAKEKADRREQVKREAEHAAARLQVENARRKREQAEEAVRRKAEQVRQHAQEQARLQAEQEEQAAERRAMEEQPIQRAAVELAHKPTLKPVAARVKTNIDTPSRQRHSGEAGAPKRRKRQPGAPNLFSLRPFRNTPEIRARAKQSQRIARLAFSAAFIAFIAVAALAARVLSLPPPSVLAGATALAIGPQGGPLLLAGDHILLHDRAGLSVSDLTLDSLGVAALQPPLAFDRAGDLLAPGWLAGPTLDSYNEDSAQLLRCNLAESHCEVFSPELAGSVISALVVHSLDDSLFIADSNKGELLKVSKEGAIVARASAELPPDPAMRLDSGLLLVNSAQGPAISVFRYEDSAFGQQLDEILLLPRAGTTSFNKVQDFLFSGDQWWALLDRVDSDGARLYRFDAQWQFIDSPALDPEARPTQLADWRGRILVSDPRHIRLQRFNQEGVAEVPLVSTALTKLVNAQEHRSSLLLLAWRIGLALSLLALTAGLCIGGLHRVRGLVYTSCRERGAEPIDKFEDTIDWIELAPQRMTGLERTGMAYAMLATGLILGAIGLGVSSLQLSALLLALVGPAVALLLLHRSDPGHIGIWGRELMLVDHTGMYHLGGNSRVQYRGPFLMIDDVTVFTGSQLLPAFSRASIEERVAPLAVEGVKVDRKIVTVKLLQSRHPLALGGLAILISAAGAIAVLSLHGIY